MFYFSHVCSTIYYSKQFKLIYTHVFIMQVIFVNEINYVVISKAKLQSGEGKIGMSLAMT